MCIQQLFLPAPVPTTFSQPFQLVGQTLTIHQADISGLTLNNVTVRASSPNLNASLTTVSPSQSKRDEPETAPCTIARILPSGSQTASPAEAACAPGSSGSSSSCAGASEGWELWQVLSGRLQDTDQHVEGHAQENVSTGLTTGPPQSNPMLMVLGTRGLPLDNVTESVYAGSGPSISMPTRIIHLHIVASVLSFVAWPANRMLTLHEGT